MRFKPCVGQLDEEVLIHLSKQKQRWKKLDEQTPHNTVPQLE